MLSAAKMEDEILGSRHDIDEFSSAVRVHRFAADQQQAWMAANPVQAIFDIQLRMPPTTHVEQMTAEEQQAIASSVRRVRVAMCLPFGYALLESASSADDLSPPSATPPTDCRFTDPLQMKSSLSALLLGVSPVYTAWFEWKMVEKMNQLAAAQQDEDDDAAEAEAPITSDLSAEDVKSETPSAASTSTPPSTSFSRAHLPLLRVLTLGDGNFSFSAAVAHMHEGKRQRSKKNKANKTDSVGASDAAAAASSSPVVVASAPAPDSFQPTHRLSLLATSFDSAADLRAKYPEAARLCEKIVGHKKERLNRVAHDVDATQLQRTLRPQMESSTENRDDPVSSSSPVPPSMQFDVIIFNHPHSGREDLALHGSLLAHFFHSANQFLAQGGAASSRTRPSQIHVTLCMKQPEDWHLLEHAWAQGFRLLSRSEFLESHYPSYETKRHHINKTFARKTIERMELFVFERRENATGEDGNESSASTPVFTRADQDATFAHNLMSHVIPLPTFKPTLPLQDAITAIQQTTRGDEADAASAAAAASSKPSLLTSITCAICHKGFASERGLFYHTANVHATPSGDAAIDSTTATQQQVFECTQCEPAREFKNESALQQHVLARHTQADHAEDKAQVNSSDEAVAVDSVVSSSHVASLPCPICPMLFTDEESLSAHLAGGVPPVSAAAVECTTCGRIFSNARGLAQHARAMSLTPELHVRITAAPIPEFDADGKALLAGGAQGRSKMKRLRGMIVAQSQGQARTKQSVVERLGVKLAEATEGEAAKARDDAQGQTAASATQTV